MKSFAALLPLMITFSQLSIGQVLKGIKVYYHDDQTDKGKNVYRELKYIGSEPFWAKPVKLDVVLSFNNIITSADNEIEVTIDELYEPTSLANKSFKSITTKTWVPHSVVYSGNTKYMR